MPHCFHFAFLALPFILAGCKDAAPRADTPARHETRTKAGERPARSDPAVLPESERNAALSQAAGRFGITDPGGGLAWAQAFEDPAAKATALEELAWSCSGTDLPAALEAALGLPSGERRGRLLSHLVAEWSTTDPAAALAWAKGLTDPDERDEALAGWSMATADRSPVEAATTAIETIRPGAVQDRAVIAVLQRWAQTDPQAAGAWVDGFPEGDLKENAIHELEAASRR